MTDKSIKHVSVSREKKLVKELKNQAKKSFKKLLMLFMKQEVHEIMIQNIWKFLLSIHKMMFQNLFLKLCKNINNDEIVQISLIVIDNDEKDSELSILWAVEILKYHINIDKKTVQSLLNNDIEINMMLYYVALKLKLVIQLNVVVVMKNAKNLKLLFIEYISDMTVRIENVIIKQSFFILEKNLNACILD